ncbi:MarR family winged helix-turn-helix transcriptional regulator [Paenibacillus mucilaginosus]|uniref:MarR family transcriptional regulator n=3 Tax=Paenibacillus mucilaginosus TaxID=61624 RepID=H6NAB4_9BACL|nr:MarR family transcriptional regulator [Paenibacillus mucilaginosus]AEI40755.1 MarR family transcriptional regulator [Paenibacillus mucilaginosus KNP414]AFC29360.1 MarR family transcriptional regulator [Paenibacillus mucilaginosus 3016]AFH61540.2 MarR family transcriptional regulator [Paenibacillus mucilaginosus K02]MCG7211766.1 MarR family transcriptional regulator [Paenibacillus mucilaginosus]WDM29881.1 MarR family transcriptional regulator [Paenibacillus mucilaginosus]
MPVPFQLDEAHAGSLKLFVVLSKAYKAIMEQAEKDVKQYGLSPSEFMILEVLYAKGRIPLQQIGEKVLITSGSITYNIDKLEKKELLRRVPCKEDRRVTYAEITEAGNELFHRIFPQHAARIHDLMKVISPEDQQMATGLLKQLGKAAEAR